jgi:hypothetical protein
MSGFDNLHAFEIPVVSTPSGLGRIAVVNIMSVELTDREAAMLASYIDFECHRYYDMSQPELICRMGRRNVAQLPTDSFDFNTHTFWKRGEGDWAYTMVTFLSPDYLPLLEGTPARPFSLEMLLDSLLCFEGITITDWTIWKHEHADIFFREG